MVYIIGVLAIITAFIHLWYLIRTLVIMMREHVAWAVGGFFVAPILQAIFYFNRKDSLTTTETAVFIKFLVSFIVCILLTVIFIIQLGSTIADILV